MTLIQFIGIIIFTLPIWAATILWLRLNFNLGYPSNLEETFLRWPLWAMPAFFAGGAWMIWG